MLESPHDAASARADEPLSLTPEQLTYSSVSEASEPVRVTAWIVWEDGVEELVAAERPRGVFSRQLILGDNLDTEKIAASYDAGVLTLRIPVAERAKPRKIEVTTGDAETKVITA